ncbi:zinc ribbon domain-containing protein [Caryophanon latum]|uniref:Uncharacterized protein n=1 Tax=Caryophanon latum TaxID=33977 RepID=A0A1C0YTA6_9BACL|nr:zinc ribbon domain-containing protein [Caryophanon latum]OCS90406.1 hypothetical protein A6K76_11110 [Caryophanon latum]
MSCIHCQQQHASYDTYCPMTGKLIDDTNVRKYTYELLDFCMSCGQANDKKSLHCSQCGTQTSAVTPKNKVGHLLDQSLTAIPDLTRNMDFEKGKMTVKNATKQHSAYIKRTPLILLPVAISIVIMLIFSAVIVHQFKDDLSMVGDLLDLDEMNVFDPEMLSAALSSELGIDVDIPALPIFTMFIAMLHNIDLSLSMELIKNGDDYVKQMKQSNIFLGLMLIPVIALCIGAIVYGIMAKKYQWHFWRGIAYSSVLYTLFLTITSLFARYKAKASGVDSSDDIASVTIKLVPSLLDTVVTGVLLSGFIFGLVAYVTYAGKGLLAKINEEYVYMKYTLYALAVTAIGLFVHFINAFIALKSSASSAGDSFLEALIMEQIPSGVYYIVSMYTGVMNWYLTFFGKINMQGDSEFIEYTWFFKEGIYAAELEELIEMTTFIPPVMFVVITFVLLASIGALLTKWATISIKEAAIVAAIFAAIQIVLLYFVNIEVQLTDDGDKEALQFGVVIVRQFITTALFAFAAIFAGSYGKIKWQQRV